jgi:uncharacterized protein with FMN-binding domain
MRRFAAVLVATVAGLVVLLSFKTASTKQDRPVALSGTTPGSTAPATSVPATSAPGSSPAPQIGNDQTAQSPAPTPTTSSKPAPSAVSGTKTVTGAAVPASEGGRRIFGMVAVRLTIVNGKITAATAVSYPNNDRHSAQISSFAIPVLNGEVLAAQGGQIDAVSGATITSNAYAESLQSALDQAKA